MFKNIRAYLVWFITAICLIQGLWGSYSSTPVFKPWLDVHPRTRAMTPWLLVGLPLAYWILGLVSWLKRRQIHKILDPIDKWAALAHIELAADRNTVESQDAATRCKAKKLTQVSQLQIDSCDKIPAGGNDYDTLKLKNCLVKTNSLIVDYNQAPDAEKWRGLTAATEQETRGLIQIIWRRFGGSSD